MHIFLDLIQRFTFTILLSSMIPLAFLHTYVIHITGINLLFCLCRQFQCPFLVSLKLLLIHQLLEMLSCKSGI
jgi:hypothetical protein